ncbi:MAG: lytic transglycosylase domain-containing protein [Bacteroidota bacterium]
MIYKKILIAFSFVAAIVLLMVFFNYSTNKPDSDTDYQKAFYKNYKIFAVEIPDSIEFAGEKVETNRFDVREGIDRELLVNTYWQSQTILLLKKAYRWFPVIEPILKLNGIPDDFKFLAVAESGLTNNLVSPAGAAGMWQFIKESAIQYGLEVNENIDERYNVEKSTLAACKYIKEAYVKYKSWTMAAASYNVGTGSLSKSIELQKATSYYDLYLNNETARYVYRIIALKLIMSNPKDYGFYLRLIDMYPPIPTYTVEVDSSVKNLVGFAENYKLNYKILKEFNQWIRKSTLDNASGKTYYITLPKEGYINYDSLTSDIKDEPFILSDSLSK